RRLGQATPTGAVVDGVLDKLFAGVVLGGLLLDGRLPRLAAPLLAARELGQLPLVVWGALPEHRRRARAAEPRADRLRTAGTVCQCITIAALLVGGEAPAFWLVATALMGGAPALSYWRRELRVAPAPEEATAP